MAIHCRHIVLRSILISWCDKRGLQKYRKSSGHGARRAVCIWATPLYGLDYSSAPGFQDGSHVTKIILFIIRDEAMSICCRTIGSNDLGHAEIERAVGLPAMWGPGFVNKNTCSKGLSREESRTRCPPSPSRRAIFSEIIIIFSNLFSILLEKSRNTDGNRKVKWVSQGSYICFCPLIALSR